MSDPNTIPSLVPPRPADVTRTPPHLPQRARVALLVAFALASFTATTRNARGGADEVIVGDGFRVDSRIYATRQDPPPSAPQTHQVSLIEPRNGQLRAYDYRTEPTTGEPTGEVTIYDAAQRRYVVLDLDREVRMEMTWDDVTRVVAHAQMLAEREEGLWQVAASGKFSTESWPRQDRLVLTSPALSYQADVIAVPQGADQATARLYQQFADAFARWNTVRTGLPPRARQALNERIAERGALPQTVALTCKLPGRGSMERISRHDYVWQWSEQDQRHAALFQQQMREFKRVSAREFLQSSTAKR